MTEERIVAATGHRPEYLGGYGMMPRLIDYAAAAIERLRPEELISGMALGWDKAVALACVRLRVPFTAAVPFDGQDRLWPRESRELHNRLLAHAKTVVVVSPGGFAKWKFIARDKWMVDHADAILALWNEQEHGGTYQCVKYAEKVGRPIHQVWAGWKECAERYAA